MLRNAKKLIPFLNKKEKQVVEKQTDIDEVNTTAGKLHERLDGLVKSANLAVVTLQKEYPLLANRVLVHGEGGGITQAFRDWQDAESEIFGRLFEADESG